MRNLKKNILSGLAVSLVLAMAIGSFALGEAQTPVTPQVASTNDGETGDFVVDGDASEYSFDDTTLTLTIHGTHTISMAPTATLPTTQHIFVDDTADITLNNVKIDTPTSTSALTIENNAKFNVNITLVGENVLIARGRVGNGIRKGDDGEITPGKLTITGSGTLKAAGGAFAAGIGGSNFNGMNNATGITIKGTTVEATGGIVGAGIGGGSQGNGSDIEIIDSVVKTDTTSGGPAGAGIGGGAAGNGSKITITNSTVIAIGGGELDDGRDLYTAAAAIGGGGGDILLADGTWAVNPGTGSENKIDDSSILIAKGGADGTYPKDVLEGFDEGLPELIFMQKTDSDVSTGTMYGDVVLKSDLAMPENATLTIPQDKTFTINEGKTLTVPDGSILTNDGTLTIKGTLSCTGTGKVETLLNYNKQLGMTKANDDNHVLYQDATEVKQYENMPSVEKEGYDFDGWYTKEKGQGTKVEEGDNVLLNEHTLYANWIAEPEPTPTPPTPTPPGPEPGPEPTPTPEPTPDPSVDPGQDGDGSGASSKTSDPFMGGIALALLGVATTGAILTRKFK